MALAGGSSVTPDPENGVLWYLPRIVCASQTLRLPLCAATSLGLETALLSPDREQRRQVLCGLVNADPVFFLWVVCRAWWAERQEVLTPEAAADWLAGRLLNALLAGSRNDLATEKSPWRAAELRTLVERYLHPYQALAWLAFAASSFPASKDGPPSTTDNYVDAAPGSTSEFAGSKTALDPQRLLPPRLPAVLKENANQQVERCQSQAIADWLHEDAGTRTRLPQLIDRLACLQQLETQFEERLEHEKIESLRQLAYGAGHEINNPLANISARAQTLLKEERDPERRRRLAAINSQAFRAHEMIADLMLFSRPPQLAVAEVNLVDLVDTMVAELDRDAKSREIVLRRAGESSAVLAQADRLQLAVALRAMCTNSLEAIGRGGTIELEAVAQGDWRQIVVRDTGPGIKAEVRQHLFDPFFSGREAGRGLGFGLSKCWRIVTEHGGRIQVESPVGGGATFTICLPALGRPNPLGEDFRSPSE